MSEQAETGAKGEEIAVEFLLKKGYTIVERNWMFKHLELDIIAYDKKTLVVVEVKTRSPNLVQQPQDSVNRKKQKLIIEATNAYIELNNIDNEIRFDVVTVLLYGKTPKIEHFEDAFYPTIK